MKKILLSLSALFAVSMASAQSYSRQPDPSTYQVVEYKATKKTDTIATKPAQAAPQVTPEKQQTGKTNDVTAPKATSTAQAAKSPATTQERKSVAQNKKK
jgi:hypothetical protein